MGVEIRKPRVLGTQEIFIFWLRNLEREKPYLIVRRRNSKSLQEHRTTEVWYKVKHELNYLNSRLLDIDVEIQDLEKRDTEKYQFTALTIKIFELKKEIYNTKIKIGQLSKLSPEGEKLLMTYKRFYDITCSFNRKAVEAVIDGEIINLGNKLGYLKIKKIKRFAPAIDWPESIIRRKELLAQGIQPKTKEYPGGENWFMYRASDFYLRWSWAKRFRKFGVPMLRNERLYAFYPTSNASGATGIRVLGAKGLLSEANNKNKLLHLRYETINI